jgi:hypothetical protein
MLFLKFQNFSHLYNADNITFIVKKLKQKMGEQVISDKYFHCFSALRKYSKHFWSPCPTIEHSKASYGYGQLRGTSTLPYLNKGTATQLCEVYFFTFFM